MCFFDVGIVSLLRVQSAFTLMPNLLSRLTFPGVLTFVVGAAFALTKGLYASFQLEMPGAVFALQPVLFVWSVGWWIQSDSRNRDISWPTDLGLFLWIAWPVVLFYHLFRTRGWKALLLIAAYTAVLLTAVIAGIVLGVAITT